LKFAAFHGAGVGILALERLRFCDLGWGKGRLAGVTNRPPRLPPKAKRYSPSLAFR
jgi:hypothetical protein